MKLETMGNLRRTHYCGEVGTQDIGKEAVVCGFVQKQRDLGSLIFIDLRDRTGIVQLSFDDSTDKALFDKAFEVRSEYVLMAKGEVCRRASVNKEIKTGEVEIKVSDLRILSQAQTPPFEIVEDSNVKDELRLKHRYLDLRRPDMTRNMVMRHKITKAARDYFDEQGFLEIETPILTKSTPEGARDYLVPSRVHPGAFYALPQSPQLYKQLLMLSGYDRYMQIARCFRDEDLRADRQPEFTQIDLEMSFVDVEDVLAVNEGFIKYLFKTVLDIDVPVPFARLTWQDAMEQYGSDKPDTRFGMKLVNLTGLLKSCEFKVFAGAIENGGSVRAICVEQDISRKEIDKLTEFVKTYGAKGLAYTRLTADGASSSYEKFLSEAEIQAIREACGAKPGSTILIVADAKDSVVFASLGALRCEIAKRLDLIDPAVFHFLWVTEFPMFEYSEEEGRFVAMHHPFTAPMEEDLDDFMALRNLGGIRAKAYDMVLNGTELGGGSIRISNPEIQSKMFEALGFTPEVAYQKFGFLLDAFSFGAPPHGGAAYGLDRLCMLILGTESLREVIAFPKVQNASELMSGCPTEVDPVQLEELGITLRPQDTK